MAVASALSVLRNTSVPFGITTPDQPNISSTRWRTLADHENLVYYFESALDPNLIRIDLKQIDFSDKAPVKKLDLVSGTTIYTGDVTSLFEEKKPFKFQGL